MSDSSVVKRWDDKLQAEPKPPANGQAAPGSAELEHDPVTQHNYKWERGVRPRHFNVLYRPRGRDPEAMENTFLRKFVWHAKGHGGHPCSFTVFYTSGERVRVSGACLWDLFDRLKRHLVFEVWASSPNPFVEKNLPEGEGLVYDITIEGPGEGEE
jgi:hypothetical protein